MLIRFVLSMCIFLFMISNAFADVKRLAVLEFRGVGIEQPILMKLSDQSRVTAADILPKDKFLIMTRENLMQILTDMGKDSSCMDGQCEVEIGRNVGADIIMTGDMMKMDGTFYLTLKLYDTTTGALLSGSTIEARNFSQLLHSTSQGTIAIFEKGLNLPAPQVPVVQTKSPKPDVVHQMSSKKLDDEPVHEHLDLDEMRTSSMMKLDLTKSSNSWVISVTATESEKEAQRSIEKLRIEGFDAHMLWIADYPSTSQKPLWLVFIGPYQYSDKNQATEVLREIQKNRPSAYGIKISQTGNRETFK